MKNNRNLLVLCLLFIEVFIFLASSCTKNNDNNNNVPQNYFTDPRDGNVYKIVTINNQVWLGENLRYLPTVVEHGIGSREIAYFYVYGYDGTDVNAAKATLNYTTYGVLYNWTAAMNACPKGWHLPSEAEWTTLFTYLGGERVAGGKLKEIGSNHWTSPNTAATNETGLTALPGGYRGNDGSFGNIGYSCVWWSKTDMSDIDALLLQLSYNYSDVYSYYGNKKLGFSVRCVRD